MQEIMWLWIGIGRSISVPEFVFADEADWNKRLNLDLGERNFWIGLNWIWTK